MCEQLYLTDDRLLFDKIRGGNAKAFEYAFRKFSPRLEAFAQKYTNDTNEAEDIVQDVFLKLWERRELLDNISLASFLFMMVRNSCLNYLKHRQIADTVQQRIPDTETAERLYAADFVPDPSSLLIQKELSDSIDQIMEITEKVVEKHITRALKRFRDGLRRYALLLGTLLSLWKW